MAEQCEREKTKPVFREDAGGEQRFKLNAGNADFPYILSDYHFAIFPNFEGKMDWQAGFGTGGYVIERFEPGVRATFKRNPNYFKAGRAHFDE